MCYPQVLSKTHEGLGGCGSRAAVPLHQRCSGDFSETFAFFPGFIAAVLFGVYAQLDSSVPNNLRIYWTLPNRSEIQS